MPRSNLSESEFIENNTVHNTYGNFDASGELEEPQLNEYNPNHQGP